MEKQLRCRDCKMYRYYVVKLGFERCWICGKRVNPGQFACKRFVYRDK